MRLSTGCGSGCDRDVVRVAIVAESFSPDVNGVTNSVLRVLDHLTRRGHDAIVVAPGDGPARHGPTSVVRVPSIRFNRHGAISVGLPTKLVDRTLADFAPDVVHLAAPVVLGAVGVAAAERMGVATVAVYQTDLPAFARRYGVGIANRRIWSWLRRVHNKADVTLAPSRHSVAQLRANGVARVEYWPRGVDQRLFDPGRRRASLRRAWSPDGRPIVGYVGRLAPEKDVGLLAPLADDRRCRLVVIGDGPSRPELEALMPGAVFTGFLHGADLAEGYASLDLFVHPGRHETFCQSLQEALASGVPAVAPAAGGPLDLVLDGVNGRFWDPRRPASLVEVATDLLDDDRRRPLAVGARPSVAARTWEEIGDRLLDHYDYLRALRVRRGAA